MEKAPRIVLKFQKDGQVTIGLGFLRWHGGRPYAAPDAVRWNGPDNEPGTIPLDAEQIELVPGDGKDEEHYLHRGVVILDK